MNNMYDILAKLESVEKKQLNEDASVVKTNQGFSAQAPAGKRLSTTVPTDRPLQPSDVKVKDLEEESPISSYKTTPGFDPSYQSPIGSGALNEPEELEDLMSKSALTPAELNRQNMLYKKYGINSPEDAAKLPDIKAQAMKDIRGQQELVGKDLEARNAQAAKEREAELARMRAFAGVGKAPAAKSDTDLKNMPLPAWYVKEEELEEKFDQPVEINPAEKGKYEGKTKEELLKQYRALKKSGPHKKGSEALGKMRELAFAIRAKSDWGKVDEAEVEEGNDFTKARLDAIKAGKPTFSVGGKTYKVTGDTSDEKSQMNESVEIEESFVDFFDKKQMYKKIGADVDGKANDYTVTFKDGSRKRFQDIDGRRRVTTLEPIDRNDAVDDEGEVVKRGRGRPKGTGKKMGARGKTNVREEELEEDYDKDEYDEEGEMAKSQARTIEDAAQELQDILDADENLPEWVQKKIAIAQEYIDSARDYLKANRPEGEEEMDVEVTGDEEVIPERELTKPEIKKREEIVKSMKKDKAGFEKRYGKRGEAVMYATATKQAKEKAEEGKEEDEEKVEETTVAGSVATAPATGKAKGMFGKGVYESSFDNKLKAVLNEGMSINMSVGENGEKSLSVNATEDDAVKLAQILKLAGMESAHGYEEACPTCGQAPCGCDEQVDEDYANSPDEVTADTDYMTMQLSGGLNGPKTTGQTTGSPYNRDPERQGVMGKRDADILEATERKLAALYKQYEGN